VNVSFGNHDFDGKKAFLTNYDTGDTIDSFTVKEKMLVIEGDVENPFFARLCFEHNTLDFIVEPGEIMLEWGDKPKVSGTPLNDKYNALLMQLERYENEWQSIANALRTGKITDEEAQERDEARKAEILNVLYNNFLANKDNVLGEWAFTQYVINGEFSPSELALVLKKVPERFAKLKRVRKVVENANAKEKTGIGKKFVDFTINGIDGNSARLSQFVADGHNYTLVYFWASWCQSCKKEIAGPLTYLNDKYNGNGLSIVGVPVWDKPSDAQSAIKELSISWPMMVGNHYITEPTELYGIEGIPYAILISPEGNIVNRGMNGDALIKAVEAMFDVK